MIRDLGVLALWVVLICEFNDLINKRKWKLIDLVVIAQIPHFLSLLLHFPPSRSISDSLLSFSHRSLITTTFLVCSASLLINRFKSESSITFQSIDSAFAIHLTLQVARWIFAHFQSDIHLEWLIAPRLKHFMLANPRQVVLWGLRIVQLGRTLDRCHQSVSEHWSDLEGQMRCSKVVPIISNVSWPFLILKSLKL